MNITVERNDAVNARIAIIVTKDDYQSLVKKSLDNLRKNTTIAGFRKGNIPHSIIQSMYGKNVLVEELNKLVSSKLSEYIKANNLYLLGEPLLSRNNLNLEDKQENYEFIFDIGLRPEVNIGLSRENELPYYTIAITDEMIEKQINTFKMQYGRHDTNIDAVENGDMVKGKLAEMDENNVPQKDGLNLNEVVLMSAYIKDEAEKKKFIGNRVGDVIVFSPYKAFEGHETELSYLLRVKKTEVANYQGNFSLCITEISRYKEAEINQELFDKLYGKGVVTSEEVFKERIKEKLISQLQHESDYRLLLDTKQLLLEQIKDIQFPEDFLKRWLIESNSKITEQTIEKDFQNALQDVKTQFIWSKIIEDNGIKVEVEDIKQTAKTFARSQFALYNLHVVTDSMLESHANEMLKTEEGIRQLHNKTLEWKIINILKEKLKLKPVTINEEEFRKLSEY